MTGRLYGSLKAIDPTTGDIKAAVRLDFPNYSGALATRAISYSLARRTEPSPPTMPKPCNRLGVLRCTGINAPAISYSVNGKQYIAVLAGSRQSAFVMQDHPSLKYSSTTSMLFVFAL